MHTHTQKGSGSDDKHVNTIHKTVLKTLLCNIDAISISNPEPYVRYSTALKIKLTENGSSQGPNTFTYERCPLGLFMVRRICTWVIDKYSFFNLKDRCSISHTYPKVCNIAHYAIKQIFKIFWSCHFF